MNGFFLVYSTWVSTSIGWTPICPLELGSLIPQTLGNLVLAGQSCKLGNLSQGDEKLPLTKLLWWWNKASSFSVKCGKAICQLLRTSHRKSRWFYGVIIQTAYNRPYLGIIEMKKTFWNDRDSNPKTWARIDCHEIDTLTNSATTAR